MNETFCRLIITGIVCLLFTTQSSGNTWEDELNSDQPQSPESLAAEIDSTLNAPSPHAVEALIDSVNQAAIIDSADAAEGDSLLNHTVEPRKPGVIDELTSSMILIPSFVIKKPEWHSESADIDTLADSLYSPGYYIDQYEVSNRDFALFLGSTDDYKQYHDSRMQIIWSDSLGFHAVEGYENYPVSFVSWFGANRFAEWAGKSLPTRLEWLVAYLGNSENIPDRLNKIEFHTDLTDEITSPINLIPSPIECGMGKIPATDNGLHEMLGNMAEWCLDTEMISSEKEGDNLFAEVAGGSFLDPPGNLHPGNFRLYPAEMKLQYMGFRCIKRISE